MEPNEQSDKITQSVQKSAVKAPVVYTGLIATLVAFSMVFLLTLAMSAILLVKSPEETKARSFLNELLHSDKSGKKEKSESTDSNPLPHPGFPNPRESILPELGRTMHPDNLEEEILQYFHDQIEQQAPSLRWQNRHNQEPGPSHRIPSGPEYESFFDGAMNTLFMNVHETDSAYEITVPVSRKDDAANVKVKVSQNRIEVQGHTTFTDPHDGHEIQTSTFSRIFKVKNAVDASRITRHFDGKMLVITVPKVDMDSTEPIPPESQESPPATQTPRNHSRETLQNTHQSSLPLDGYI